MNAYEMLSREDRISAEPTVDHSVFHNFILPPGAPHFEESPNTVAKMHAHQPPPSDGSAKLKAEKHLAEQKIELPREQSPDNGVKPFFSGKSPTERSNSPDPYGHHQGWQRFVETVPDNRNVPALREGSANLKAEKPLTEQKHELRANPDNAVDRREELKTGAAAVAEYVSDLSKLAIATSGDIDTAFELMMVWKGSSLQAREVLSNNRPEHVSTLGTQLVFSSSDEKDKNWELRIDSRTGDAVAMRFNAKSLQMEPVEAGPLKEHVSMTLRATLAIKCFCNGDGDAGRLHLKALLEHGQMLEADDRVKKIIATEAELIFKSVRLRALTREEFDKILAETEVVVRQSKKKR